MFDEPSISLYKNQFPQVADMGLIACADSPVVF